MDLNIPKFECVTIKGGETCMAIGMRGSGKTSLLCEVLSQLKDTLDLCVGMSDTEDPNNPKIGKFIPKCLMYQGYNENKLINIYDWQRRCVQNGKTGKIGVILDDLGNVIIKGKKTRVLERPIINEILKKGRHKEIFLWTNIQMVMDAPPAARGNTDLIFLYKIIGTKEVKDAYDHYFNTAIPLRKDFTDLLQQIPEYFCLVLDTRLAKRGLPAVFWYCAKLDIPPVCVGLPVYWGLSEKLYSDKADNEMDVEKCIGYDPSKKGIKFRLLGIE